MSKQEIAAGGEDYSTQRLSQRYRFSDPNMDLFFLGALGWAPAGGISAGEVFQVSTTIEDGNADSWASVFEAQGETLVAQADQWIGRGETRAAGETRLRAFTCFRLAWQFVSPGDRFLTLFHRSQQLFDMAMEELGLPSQRFAVPYGSSTLPGHFFRASDPSAPTILIIGGADTCHEDRFLSQGRYYIDRGYNVALADLPGQGSTPADGLFWEPETEKPVGAVLDFLIEKYGVDLSRLALLGMSLGGYFAARSAAEEPRLAAVIATPVLSHPSELFMAAVGSHSNPSQAGQRNMDVLMWKGGTTDLPSLARKWEGTCADPAKVRMPFLSVLGTQEGGVWQKQTLAWSEGVTAPGSRLLVLGPETGADAHCQGNNPLRLVQEVQAWLNTVFSTP
ncbi:2,6-dihydropseudooxynicotine hydrolase [Pandoraea communis]|uniref:2,6-dihydropseudooxynicotine hydrolase n=1 Tax=Pandoraea communis TaxID=2508297 RepID=A0A5E4TYQ7_9BURK|nr:alpha/beta fold hydrolase [Pandoraea communis]VVD92353.1 2,6-dihydropseudooxynicotine hydrolase [Pandoraea communis]